MAPLGKNRVREYGLIQRVEVAGPYGCDLLRAGASLGERGFDSVQQSGLDRGAFVDAACHEPLGHVGLKGVVGQESPERFFLWCEAKLTAVLEKFGAGEAEFLPNRAGGGEGFLQVVFPFELRLQALAVPKDRVGPEIRRQPDEVTQYRANDDIHACAPWSMLQPMPRFCRGHPAALGRLQDAGHDLQKRALARTVRAYQGQGLALFDLEADIAQGPKVGVERTLVERQGLTQAVGGAPVELVEFGYVLEQNHKILL